MSKKGGYRNEFSLTMEMILNTREETTSKGMKDEVKMRMMAMRLENRTASDKEMWRRQIR